MFRILTLNLDFVLILQAGLLLFLGTMSLGLSRRNSGTPWRWFGVYAFLQALRTGVQLAAMEIHTFPISPGVDQALLAFSSLALVEFARRNDARRPGRWVHGPVAAVLLTAWFGGGSSLAFGTGTVVALLAGAWSARTLWRSAPPAVSAAEKNPCRQIALALLAAQLIGATPENYLRAAVAALDPDLPPALLSCTLFLLLLLPVLQLRKARETGAASLGHTAARQHRRLLCGLAILLIGLAGWLGAGFAGRKQDESMRQQIFARTQIAAASVLAENVRQLLWDERDLENPAYQKLKAQMIAMRQANADLRFVLLAGVRAGRAYFLVDSEPPDSADYSPPGQSYDEATADYLAGLHSGRAFLLGPETDRWGTWMFGDVPIVDAQGRALAYLELDIAAADWDARIRLARLPVLLITLLIIALVLGSYQALERLRESSTAIALSEERNRSLVEGSPDCVQMFDLAGRYVAVNQNGLRALGLPEAQVLGRHFADLWPAASRTLINDAVRDTCLGRPTTVEADYLTPDGHSVTWRVATNPVRDPRGKVCSFVGICVDLTARKQMELALIAAKKSAEDATQAKSDFLAVMSHEIRTPLSGIVGMLDLLQQSPLEAQPRRYTRFARDSADSLMHLLNDALDSAKIEAGKLSLETIAFRPHSYFEAVFESAKMRAATKGLVFHHEVGSSVPAVLLGDPTRLRQVINNLVNNALKFTNQGRVTCTLSAAPVALGSVLLHITVSDTGIGISEAACTRLFAKYAQADASTSRRYGGTGLGLSIVKSLAELMGGDVGVTSTLGQGSTFTFSGGFKIGSEAARPPAPPPPAPAVPPPAGPARPLRVLIVDDDVANRTVAEFLITSLGHHAAGFATNGREAVARLVAEKFDVVLMDSRMPQMDGFTATQLIRDPATRATDPAVYIIALTANVTADDRTKCLAAGMNDFVSKPVRAPAMSAALARAIAHVGSRRPAPAAPPPGLSEAELLATLEADEAAPAEAPGESIPPEVLAKITTIFFRETPRRLEAMRAALAAGQAEVLAREAHSLKSNARYLGATALSELAAKIEHLADHGQLAATAPCLDAAAQRYAALEASQLHSHAP